MTKKQIEFYRWYLINALRLPTAADKKYTKAIRSRIRKKMKSRRPYKVEDLEKSKPTFLTNVIPSSRPMTKKELRIVNQKIKQARRQ